MKMHIIWTNDDFDALDDIKKDIMEDNPDLTEEQAMQCAYETRDEYLEDEKANLNIEVGTDILIIATLGLWDGNHMAYKTPHITNIADCFGGTCGDYVTWFVDDRGDLNCRDCHHDGTNLYLYRAWKFGISDTQKENFLHKVYKGRATRADITKYTRKIGTYVADVYGWKVRR